MDRRVDGGGGRRSGGSGWRELDRQLLQACGIFDLYRCRRRAPNGREGDFFLLGARDWVNVVAPLPPRPDDPPGERLLMVRQYRQGLQEATVEFPAGLVEAGETPRQAARRELAEETGFVAGSLRRIGTLAPNPAFMGNRCHTFLAGSLSERGGQSLDELEMVDVLEVPLAELQRKIGRPPYFNAMTAVALFWYLSACRGAGKDVSTGADRTRTGE